MDEQFIHYLTQASTATNIGPTAKEALLQHAEDEYLNGNMTRSIFYQIVALYQASQEHYYKSTSKRKSANVEDLLAEMTVEETDDFKENCLLQYVSKSLKTMSKNKKKSQDKFEAIEIETESNFLKGITDPMQGIHKLEDICKQMPKEWTIMQLCKGPRPENTFSVYPKIHEYDAAIYLTILKHARSDRYPTPICLRFSRDDQKELFANFASIINRFKHAIKVDPKDWHTIEARKLYWNMLSELNTFIAKILADLKNFFFPWTFLFTGISNLSSCTKVFQGRWDRIDAFCNTYNWDEQSRILLSLAASNIRDISDLEIDAICSVLTENKEQREIVIDLLNEMQQQSQNDCSNECRTNRYPCILVVDERLDHFFWEEMNVYQEFTRINSIQCLWRLYKYYKKDLRNGYLNVNITTGGCVINPDQNLNKMELRMRSFFEYWMPHWSMMVGQRPTQEDLFNKFFKQNCYVYAGHGSGLQYINGRNIAKFQMHCVVFLFGCDSSRLHSNGLYSELLGPHLYYHAAMCPALVGTLMPCLDSIMDKVATEILSRWIAPKSPNTLPWNEIEVNAWVKEGIIRCKSKLHTHIYMSKSGGDNVEASPTAAIPSSRVSATIATTPDYHFGSLCGILARVHQRISEPKLYNTVPYVCRGLPVWNCNVQPIL
ncbi:uncharacterized protein LOC133330955 [Musca vetustissima]|uniref:uncharacterized protein LOC133330955 n=1 Tax=Musca vetustissima TaxID=27455 RepID=UPI002AB64CFA|nr:uncharacterized protein LOC133330955 [Musca vetustissima]